MLFLTKSGVLLIISEKNGKNKNLQKNKIISQFCSSIEQRKNCFL